jgi:hypothetical protein
LISSLFLEVVEKFPLVMLFHMHIEAASTLFHAGCVVKKAYATPHQELENVATPKSNRRLLLSCGISKNKTLT